LVRSINYKIPLDILVYSKEEYKIVKNCGNYFIDEIEKTGKVLIRHLDNRSTPGSYRIPITVSNGEIHDEYNGITDIISKIL
jgi:hypothetical protein